MYYMEEHDLPRLYNRNAGGRAFDILPDGQKVVVLFKKEGDRRPYYNLILYYYSTGGLFWLTCLYGLITTTILTTCRLLYRMCPGTTGSWPYSFCMRMRQGR